MIGIIVIGHGYFASGISSSLEMLVGKIENYEFVDFLASDSIEMFENNLNKALDKLVICEDVLVCADLVGGTPFNVAIQIKMKQKYRMEVIGGINLATILNAYMSRMTENDVEIVANKCVVETKSAILRFERKQDSEEDYEE